MLRSVTLAMLLVPGVANATLIDFETRRDGTPITGPFVFLPNYEYTSNLALQDSDPVPGSILVRQSHPDNQSPYISGYHLSVGAFAGVTTFLQFFPISYEISFDFATPSGFLHILALNARLEPVFDNWVMGTDPIPVTNPAGFPLKSGGMTLSGLGRIDYIRIEAPEREALVFDNLFFSDAPEPGTLLLLAAGLGVALLRQRTISRRIRIVP